MRLALVNDTSVTRHFGCSAVMQTMMEEIRTRGADIAFRWPVACDWSPAVAMGLFDDIDLVVVNGEGSIHNSATRERAAQLCALGPFVSESLGLPVHLVNATIASLTEDALNDLRHFRSIHVRETTTRTYLRDQGISSDVVADLSLGRPAPASRSRTGILVTDSVVPEVSACLGETAERLSGPYIRFRQRRPLLERLSLVRKAEPPFRDPVLKASLNRDLDRILRRFSGARLVMTGRFHAFCLAILTRTPVIAVESNTHKIGAMAADIFGSTSRVVPMEAAGAETLSAMAEGADYSQAELAAIDAYLDTASRARAAMWDEILVSR